MAPFLDILSKAVSGLRRDDDFYDRLSHRYTALFLMVFAVLVSTQQYVGSPIICWTPANFISNYVSYTNNYCWISNTYYMPFEERIPNHELPRPHIGYYQWVPIMMLLQSLLFYIPTVVWRLMSGSTGIDMNTITKAIVGREYLNPDKRDEAIKYLVRHMDRYFGSNKPQDKECCSGGIRGLISNVLMCCKIGKRHGNFLIFLYMITKVLYVTNAIAQLFLLNAFLGTTFHLYGFDVIRDLALNNDWHVSGRFPRVTLCDFKIRQLGGNIHRHTVQCALPINMFNEKIYIFIWFWLVFVCIATVFGFLTWISVFFTNERKQFVMKNLLLKNRIMGTEDDRQLCKAFIHDYLRQDGVWALKLLNRNSNDVIVAEFTAELWDLYRKKNSLGAEPENEKEETNL
ncbi:innexin unc-9 [Lingula anatina]|uniref:Innexin n=1 Tax=Lingula anatina TaxID=7574 RepID=A0A1S3JZB7_LINAN|nr:innexin unc-9 [Lingula anatina]|eukprot:XP_013415376.1 innexin unc-9 [Lingula anatina]